MENLILKEFTMIPNALINDAKISRDARFLFVYLASKPPGWKFYTKTIEKELNCSKDSRIKYMKELAFLGWVTNEQVRNPDGGWGAMAVHLHPHPKKADTVELPCREFSAADNNGSGKNQLLSNTDLFSNTKKESNTIESRKLKFADSLTVYVLEFGEEMVQEFFLYWSEHNPQAKKMRFEKETVFNIKLRLMRWNKNNDKFDRNNSNATINNNAKQPYKFNLERATQAARTGNT